MSEDRKTIGQIAWQTKILVETFIEREHGNPLTYAEIKKLIGGDDPQHKGRGYISSARRILLNQHEIVIACKPNIGYVKVSGTDSMGEGEAEHRSIARRARKAGRIYRATDYDTLSAADQLRWNAGMLQNALIQKLSEGKTAQRMLAGIEERKKIETSNKRLSEALDAVKQAMTK